MNGFPCGIGLHCSPALAKKHAGAAVRMTGIDFEFTCAIVIRVPCLVLCLLSKLSDNGRGSVYAAQLACGCNHSHDVTSYKPCLRAWVDCLAGISLTPRRLVAHAVSRLPLLQGSFVWSRGSGLAVQAPGWQLYCLHCRWAEDPGGRHGGAAGLSCCPSAAACRLAP